MVIESVRVGLARVADAEAIGRIHVVSWQVVYAGDLPDEFLRSLSVADRQRAWRQLLAPGDQQVRVLIVAHDGEVVGFACVGECSYDDALPETGELQSLYLDPGNWRRGLGRQLHDEALAVLQRDGYRSATLWVLHSNTRARHFFEKSGWELEGATKVESFAGGLPLRVVRYAMPLVKLA
jgi:L-amino acid N-acyltransferase YncA